MTYDEFERRLTIWLKDNIVSKVQMESWTSFGEGARSGAGRMVLVEAGEKYQMSLQWDLPGLYEEYIEYGWAGMTRTIRKALRSFGLLKGKTTEGFREDLPQDRRPLFDELCRIRRECARTHAVPPYLVFSNKALYGMALLLPASEEEMMDISGVGQRNFSLYGEKFLEILKAAAQETESAASMDRI